MNNSVLNNHSKIFSLIVIFTFVLVLFISTGFEKKTEGEVALKTGEPMQEKADLLAGIPNAVAYSGFRNGQHPDRGNGAKNPSDAEIIEDLEILTRDSNFRLIRMYDSQENTEAVLRIIKEKKFDMKVLLGIWLDAEFSNHEGCAWLTEPIPEEALAKNKLKNQAEVARGLRLANEYPEIIVALNVGNEAIVDWTDHKVPVETVIEYVKTVKQAINQPVTVAEVYDAWIKHCAELVEAVDFISVHTYPVWEGKTIDEGFPYAMQCIKSVKDVYPDKPMVITETGWATIASEFGERASEENQKRYCTEFNEWAISNNVTTFIFEAFDEDWKGDPANPIGAEKHWGLFNVDRTAKLMMQELYPDLKPAE